MTIPAAGTYLLDPAHKRIGFLTRHMMVSPVRGDFAEASAAIIIADDPLRSSVTATIQAASISTGQVDRDTHLRSADFLDVVTYPTLEYRSTGVRRRDDPIFYWAQLRDRGNRGDRRVRQGHPAFGRFSLTGDLTVKATTRPVELQVEFGGARRDPEGRDVFGFTATAEIDREDYGLRWNVVLDSGGVLVGRTVRIEIAGEAIRQS